MMNHSIIESGGMKVEVKGKRVWINGREAAIDSRPKVKGIDYIQLFIGGCIGFAIATIIQNIN